MGVVRTSFWSTRWVGIVRVTVIFAVITATLAVIPPAKAAPPEVFFQSATSSVGESGTSIDVTVELFTNGVPLGAPLTVDVVDVGTGDASAAGVDYTYSPSTQSVQFEALDTDGETRTVTITIDPDTIDEPDETIDLALQNSSGGDIDPARDTHQVTITDDDDPPTVSVSAPTSVSEGSSATFDIDLSTASGRTVTVNYATASGTATSGSDFTGASSQVTFLPTETNKTVNVATAADGVYEPGADETFSLNLSTPVNATAGTMSDSTAIIDGNSAPDVTIDPGPTVAEGSNAVFNVTLSGPVDQSVTVDWATSNGSATSPADYVGDSGTVTFDPLDTSEPVTVSTVDDGIYDGGNETFMVTLSNPSIGSLGEPSSSTATITDGQGAPTINIGNGGSVGEGSPATFTVTLTGPVENPVSASWAVVHGTTDAADFDGLTSGSVVFSAGSTTPQTITVNHREDAIDEATESYSVVLSGVTGGADNGDLTGTGSIVDTDLPPTLTMLDTSALESATHLVFAVNLDAISGRDIKVDYTTSPHAGTATVGSDYSGVSGTLTIPAGDPSGQILVPILPDSLDEANETMTLRLSGEENVTIATGSATAIGTINDNDQPPELSVTTVISAAEGDSVDFEIALSSPSGLPVRVTYLTETVPGPGGATAGADYVAISPTVHEFTPGTDKVTVSVDTLIDGIDEATEEFRLRIQAAVNADLPVPSERFGTGRIIDIDGEPTVSIDDAPAVTEAPGGVLLTYTVNLGGSTEQDVTVDWTTADGTATATADYTPVTVPESVTFLAGDREEEITVTVLDDAIDEIDETVLVNLTNLVVGSTASPPADITDPQGEGVIVDDDNEDPEASIEIMDQLGNPRITFSPGEIMRLKITYTDAGVADTHDVSIDWGDASPPVLIADLPPGTGVVERTHVYSAPAGYQVSVSVADKDLGEDSASGFVSVTSGSFGGHSTALVDPSQGRWFMYNTSGSLVSNFYFGNPGDYPFMGDWDGDGIETPGLYRQSDGFVYLRNSNTAGPGEIRFFFGNPGDVPIAGDFNNDGRDTVSIYRPSNQTFYIINKLGENDGGLGAAEKSYVFGNPGDKPFVGDFDGDGIETVGLHRESTGLVYFRNSHTQGVAHKQFIFGDPGDRIIAGDWNGNGQFSPGLFRPTNTTMYFRFSNTQGVADNQWGGGQPGWIPVSGVTGF